MAGIQLIVSFRKVVYHPLSLPLQASQVLLLPLTTNQKKGFRLALHNDSEPPFLLTSSRSEEGRQVSPKLLGKLEPLNLILERCDQNERIPTFFFELALIRATQELGAVSQTKQHVGSCYLIFFGVCREECKMITQGICFHSCVEV